jgi:hypothetical protein
MSSHQRNMEKLRGSTNKTFRPINWTNLQLSFWTLHGPQLPRIIPGMQLMKRQAVLPSALGMSIYLTCLNPGLIIRAMGGVQLCFTLVETRTTGAPSSSSFCVTIFSLSSFTVLAAKRRENSAAASSRCAGFTVFPNGFTNKTFRPINWTNLQLSFWTLHGPQLPRIIPDMQLMKRQAVLPSALGMSRYLTCLNPGLIIRAMGGVQSCFTLVETRTTGAPSYLLIILRNQFFLVFLHRTSRKAPGKLDRCWRDLQWAKR